MSAFTVSVAKFGEYSFASPRSLQTGLPESLNHDRNVPAKLRCRWSLITRHSQTSAGQSGGATIHVVVSVNWWKSN